MIRHPQYSTLDNFLQYIRERVTKGLAIPSAGLTLSWYAEEYRKELAGPKPAEPGASSKPSSPLMTLEELDDLRVMLARGEHKQVGQKLEEISTRR